MKQVSGCTEYAGFFTGEYKGTRVSTLGHGMGIPSISIYATELINGFGVKKTSFRVGSCGAVSTSVELRDIIIAMGASTNSSVNRMRFKGAMTFAAIADFRPAGKCGYGRQTKTNQCQSG